MGAGGRASGRGGLGVTAGGGGGKRGSPPARPGSLGAAACRQWPPVQLLPGGWEQAGVRAACTCHARRGAHRGETAMQPWTLGGLQQLLSLPVPCLPDFPAGLNAAGIGECPRLQLLKPERPPGSPPAPSSRRSRLAAPRQGPSGSPPDRAASTPRVAPSCPRPGSGAQGPPRRIAHGTILAAV